MFLTTLQQVAILLIFIAIGYFFRKKNIINDGAKKTMAALLVNLFAPAYSISSLSQQLSIEKIIDYGLYFIGGIAITIFFIFFAILLAKLTSRSKKQQNLLKYVFAFGNVGYFGYPVVGAVFGEEVKALMILFCIPMSIAISTYGYTILMEREYHGDIINSSARKKYVADRLRFLYSAPFIGTMVGLIIGLAPITLPRFVIDLLNLAGNCHSAIAMILTGTVLASTPILRMFKSIKAYVIAFIRLVGIPIIVGGILYIVHLFGANGPNFVTIYRLCVIVSAMPVGMNVVIFPESCGRDSTKGAKMCLMSYIMSLLALPLVFTLMEMVIKTF